MSKHSNACFLLFLLILLSLPAVGNNNTVIIKTENTVSIGNEYLAREFSIRNSQVHTVCIANKRTGANSLKIVPGNLSEEFIIHTLNTDSVAAEIPASALLLEKVTVTTEKEDTKKLVFHYKPHTHQGIEWKINMVFTLQPGKHYMRKYLEIEIPETKYKEARIDFIDFESLQLPENYITWTHPEMAEGVGGVNGYYISLGQPIYIQGMFFGSEFPVTETEITKENIAHIRYYSGKSFDLLQKENKLVNGIFTTWSEVSGAARSTDMDVIQSDFFSYIQDISIPVQLRIQYNSWYDFMMDIDESNILTSFREIERGLTQHGVRPLDSYVVDDGWNAYGPYLKENKEKFWSFNSKFPNRLTTPTGLAHRFSSDFGLWLGPRGGYNYMDTFAKFLEKNGNGKLNENSQDICTNHRVYLQKLKEFFLDCQQEYDINYWKLDGFMVTPPQPDPEGNYISGGYRGMYYVTEHWERWIDIFRAMREERGDKQHNLWINLTCYMNPSPWFLQWVNSTWIQNSGDIGRLDTGRPAQLDLLLTYRDGRYFDFVKTRAFQFPLANVYNHDPIYGNTANLANKMNDNEFRTYLFMMATRGTAFWELYYSYNMMEEGQKWAINAEVLQWIEENYPVLRHAKLIGNTPEQKTPYGYSAWQNGKGIISLRNPSNRPQVFSFVLDRNIGLQEGLKNLHRTPVWIFNGQQPNTSEHLFNYGDKFTVTLNPGEVQIWKFNTEADKKAPEIKTVKTVSSVKLTVEFNEPVRMENASFNIKGNKIKETTLLADRKTIILTLSSPMKKNTKYKLGISGTSDYSGNITQTTVPFTYYQACQIPLCAGVDGIGDFTIAFNLKTKSAQKEILRQGKDILFSLDTEGRLVATIKAVKVVSSRPVNKGQVTGLSVCREKNGMLKIYINGELDNSAFNPKQVNPRIKACPLVTSKEMKEDASDIVITNYALSYKEVASAFLK